MTVDVAQIQGWATRETEIGAELPSYQRYQGLGVDPLTGDVVDYSGEWSTRDIDEMLAREGKARAGEQALTLPLRGAPLTVKPAAGDNGEAEHVNGVLDSLGDTVDTLIGQAAQSLIYRMTFLEKLWAVRDGQFVYDRLAWRPTDACAPLRDRKTGALTGFRQTMSAFALQAGQPSFVKIPTAKAVVFVHGQERDPIRGVSEMAVAYRCYTDKQKIRFLWSTFLEGAAVDRVIATAPQGQEAATTQALAKLKNAGVVTLPAGTTAQTMSVSGEGGQAFLAALGYLDSEMLDSILAGFLGLTGSATAGRGSYALSKDQSDFFLQAQESAAREIAATIRAQVVRPLVVVNFGTAAAVPAVTLGPINRASVQEQITLLQALAANPAGSVAPAEFLDELVLKIAGYLDLDTDKVAAAIKTAAERAAAADTAATTAEAAQLHGALGAATGIVSRAKAGESPLPA